MQAILATLGYVLSPDRRRVLMIRRDARPDDIHYGFHNGLGVMPFADGEALSWSYTEL